MYVNVHTRLRSLGVLRLDTMAEEHTTLSSIDFLCTIHSPGSIHCLSKDRGDLVLELKSSNIKTEGRTLAHSKL